MRNNQSPISFGISEHAERLSDLNGVDFVHLYSLLMGDIPYYERGSGKTFAKCYEVIQKSLLEKKLIMCRLEFYSDIYHIIPMFRKICDYLCVTIKRRNTMHDYLIEDNRIRFFVEDEKIYGMPDYLLVEFWRD